MAVCLQCGNKMCNCECKPTPAKMSAEEWLERRLGHLDTEETFNVAVKHIVQWLEAYAAYRGRE